MSFSNLKKKSKTFFDKNKDIVIDILLFGSIIQKNVRQTDVDITLITQTDKKKSIELADQFEEILGENFHVTYNCISDLFSKKEPIWLSLIHEGTSLVTGKKLVENLFLEPKILYNYSLTNLQYKDKVRFFYALKGRKQEGILKMTKSLQLAKGVFLTPVEFDREIEDFFKQWGIVYHRRRILIEQ